VEEASGGGGDFVDGGLELGLVGLGRLGEAADFADELERGVADFLVGDRRVEIEKNFYIATHV
jgi:hypothetical protein